jgi:hypothetical protein
MRNTLLGNNCLLAVIGAGSSWSSRRFWWRAFAIQRLRRQWLIERRWRLVLFVGTSTAIDVIVVREAPMSGNVREIIEFHHCFCEVSPYYILSEDRPVKGAVSARRVHVGFDLDIYGVKMSCQPDPPAEYWLVYTKLKEIVDLVRHENKHACSIDVIPFGSTIVLDTRDHLQPLAMLRIRITSFRGIQEPAGAAEQEALKAVEAHLSNLAIAAGRSRS